MPSKTKIKEEPTLTRTQVTEAALNDPVLSPDSIELNGRTFKIVYLKYDDYVKFLNYLAPVFETLLSQTGLSQAPQLDLKKLFEACHSTLPEMAQLILKQTDPGITLDEVKDLCGDPFKICELIVLQIQKNNMIRAFSDFFPQVMALMNP